MPAQLANESFRADHVRFGNSVGAVVQVLMRSDIPAPEAFFRDHLRAHLPVFGGQLRSGVQDGAGLGEASPRRLGNPSIFETFPRLSLDCETNSFPDYLRPCFIEAIFAAIIARRVSFSLGGGDAGSHLTHEP